MIDNSLAVVWLRRDLRLQDNTALTEGSKSANNVANFFTIQKISVENRVLRKRTLIGFSIFGISILIMLILTGIYGPIKV